MIERRTINGWCELAFKLAREKGFHKKDWTDRGYHTSPERLAARLALIHAEISEALECVARGRMETYLVKGKPEGFGPELADVFLRLADLAKAADVNLESEIIRKHMYNETRPLMHGGKRL